MSAYMIIDLEIHDQTTFEGYQKSVPALILKHGELEFGRRLYRRMFELLNSKRRANSLAPRAQRTV